MGDFQEKIVSSLEQFSLKRHQANELLLGQFRPSVNKFSDCATKIVNHFGNVQTRADEEKGGREENEVVRYASRKLQTPVEVIPYDHIHVGR